MKLNVALGSTLRSASINAIKQIDVSNCLELNNFVVVPDRFSLLAEKTIFEQLKIKSTFNIKVVSISKLASLVLNLANINFKQQNQIEGALIVENIILNNLNSISSFNKENISYDLAKDIYLAICQIKSSDITAEQFIKSSKNLSTKLQDLAFIFNEYTNIKKEKLDPNDVLEVFKNQIENSEIIKSSNFYFIEFDSLTKQSYEIFKLLVKCARSVTVACVKPLDFFNSHIYELDIKSKVEKVCAELKLAPNIIDKNENFNSFNLCLTKNMFSLKKEKQETKNVNIIAERSEENEVSKICNLIAFNIKEKNKKYKDFNILLPDYVTYKNLIEKYFDLNEIPYYIDEDYSFYDLHFAKFILNVLKFLTQANEENYLELLGATVSEISCETFKKVNSLIFEKGKTLNEILAAEEDENIKEFNKKIINLSKKWKKTLNVSNLIEIIKDIYLYFNFSQINIEIINYFKNLNNFSKIKLYEQFENKFNLCITTLENLGDNVLLEEADAIKAVEEIFKGVTISCLPLSLDAVFVGQTSASFFDRRNTFIFMGAVDGRCPVYSKDVGLINDGDIDELAGIEIEPTIKLINKRNKFKLFNDITLAQENIVVSFCQTNKTKASELVEELQNIFTKNGKSLPVASNFYEENINDKNLKLNKIIFESCVKNSVGTPKQILDIASSKEFGNLIFKANKTSISKLQKFNSCPFAHFAEFGLEAKEKDLAKINAKDIGILFHSFAEHYLKSSTKNIQNIFNHCISSNERLSLLCSINANKVVFKTFYKEILAFAENLNKELASSEFKPLKLEQFFSLPFTLNNGKSVSINGIIDRIDLCENYIRVIDYKTGEMKLSISKLFSGEQIQLPIYALAAEKLFNKICAGMFYFPIVSLNDRNKDKRLFGFFEKNIGVIKKLDKAFALGASKGEVLALSLTKNSFVNRTGLLEEGELKVITNYANLVAKESMEQIDIGNILAKPTEHEVCKFCKYYALCNYDYIYETEEKTDTKFTIQDIQNKLKEQGESNG